MICRNARLALFGVLAFAFCLIAVAPAAEESLADIAGEKLNLTTQEGATTEYTTTSEGRRALRVKFPAGKGYPGAAIKPDSGEWDLSKFAYVNIRLMNPGDKPVHVHMRVDNAGDWKKSPWNTEKFKVDPGTSRDLRVWFGYSWGKKAFNLDAAKVSQVLIFAENVKEEAQVFVESVSAGGEPGTVPDMIKASIGILPTGDLLALDKEDGPKMRAESKGAQAEAAKTAEGKPAVMISFGTDAKQNNPGVFIRNQEGMRWNLRDYYAVDLALRNPGDKPVKVFCRLDNNNATNDKNSALAVETLEPGQAKTVRISFITDKVWDGNNKDNSGMVFGSDVVNGLLLSTDKAGAGAQILLEGVVGVRGAGQMPEWLGKRPPVEGDWKLTFEDNFEGAELDRKIWELPVKVGEKAANCNQEPASIWGTRTVNIPENTLVEDGKLKLRMSHIPEDVKYEDPKLKGRTFNSSITTTFGTFAQKYGYFEARMKLPTAIGLWPAFWLMPDRGEEVGPGDLWWKRQLTENGGMEFDIMEYLTRWGPHRYHVALHWDGYEKNHKSTGTSNIYFQPDADGFFNAGVLWEPGKISFFCNGKLVGVWENERVCNVPCYMLFTMPFGGWGTDGSVGKLPDHFEIDYVRVWQRKDLEGK